MLINLRGTHGSGKTTVSHRLILEHEHTPVIEPEACEGKRFTLPNCFKVEGGLNVVGRWKSGMDGIFPQTIVEEMIEYWCHRSDHVLWENVMVSANIGRWAILSRKLEPVQHQVWAFFDTPLETCIERVFKRRHEAAAAGFNHRQTDEEVKLDVIAGHWRRVRRAAARAYKEGIDVRWVDHTKAYEQVHNTLVMEGNWGTHATLPSDDGKHYYLTTWAPTHEELEYVLKTSRLPWEPEDTVTKVAYKSTPKKRTVGASSNDTSADAGLGETILRWGQDPTEEVPVETNVTEASDSCEVFGTEVQKWASPDTLVTGVETTEEI